VVQLSFLSQELVPLSFKALCLPLVGFGCLCGFAVLQLDLRSFAFGLLLLILALKLPKSWLLEAAWAFSNKNAL
jgi:hypothetical protein